MEGFESDAEEKVKKGKEGKYLDQVLAHVLFRFFNHRPELGGDYIRVNISFKFCSYFLIICAMAIFPVNQRDAERLHIFYQLVIGGTKHLWKMNLDEAPILGY